MRGLTSAEIDELLNRAYPPQVIQMRTHAQELAFEDERTMFAPRATIDVKITLPNGRTYRKAWHCTEEMFKQLCTLDLDGRPYPPNHASHFRARDMRDMVARDIARALELAIAEDE